MVKFTTFASLILLHCLGGLVVTGPVGDWEENHLFYQKAGMEGQILSIKVKPGDVVNRYQVLFTVSAMKMELDVRAPIPGVVKNVLVASGANVGPDDVAVVINTFLPRKE